MLTCPNGEYFACIFWARPERRRVFGRVLVVFEAGHSGGSVRSFSGQGNGDAADAMMPARRRPCGHAAKKALRTAEVAYVERWRSLAESESGMPNCSRAGLA